MHLVKQFPLSPLKESEIAVSDGPLSSTTLAYCGALCISQNGKNFLAHIFPHRDYDAAAQMTDIIVDNFTSPLSLRYVLGTGGWNRESFAIIAQVARNLRAAGRDATLEKVGEVVFGDVSLNGSGEISSPKLIPCALTGTMSTIDHAGVSYTFNKMAPYTLETFAQSGAYDALRDNRPADTLLVLPPYNGGQGMDERGSECALFARVALPKKTCV